jgi:archaellum biogenesis protein FlaJ (TadC family)
MAEIIGWVREHQALFQTLGLMSVVFFVMSLVVFPLVVIHLPADYFVRERRDPTRQQRRHPLIWAGLTVVKNALGLTLIVAGIAMLVLPGQGILTILIGMVLANFPGKFTLERRLFARPAVRRALNRIRAAAGRIELEVPPAGD